MGIAAGAEQGSNVDRGQIAEQFEEHVVGQIPYIATGLQCWDSSGWLSDEVQGAHEGLWS